MKNKINTLYTRVLKRLIETIEEEDKTQEECYEEDGLEEFSTTAALGGVPATPLGTGPDGNRKGPQDHLKNKRIK